MNKFYQQMERQAFKLFGITGRGYAIGFAAWTMYGIVAAGFTALGTGVNMRHIEFLESNGQGGLTITMTSKHSIKVSRSYATELRKRIV
ncbi:MAG: LytTR family DNA-binding domain-containing protein [Chloroherpetonaceae bacterium]|nr:LytTR family transcriptional regulator [Chloroherpetonaceae bacterium]MCS7210979.1 LytTR family transcriptional regulator [Chloroherpetonaceae bacterium]MDW8019112.1 LytTR family DNA-binding domain-containing protein [Chloroherpetonaceae bacterium]MDW8466945.1 LytTR family DNA-binding domain-containing protein [Chloroherpetonaceae bacterium]